MRKIFVLTTLLGLAFLARRQTPQKAIPYPDCIVSFSLTVPGTLATGLQTIPSSQSPIGCAVFFFSYYSTGFSALSVQVETAPDVAGSPGSWTAATASIGSNPNTATTSAYSQFGTVAAPIAFP